MSLKNKLILFTIFLACAGTVAGMSIFYTLISESFNETEIQLSKTNTLRVTNIINNQINSLNDKAKDWSVWDATYYYLKGSNPGYISQNVVQKNIESSGFQLLDLNWMVFKKLSSNAIEGYYFDEKAISSFAENVRIELIFNELQNSSKESIQGIDRFNDELVLFSAQKVYDNEAELSSSGLLLFAVDINTTFTDTLSELILQPLSIEAVTKGKKIVSEQWIENTDKYNLTGFFVLRDIFSHPIAIGSFRMKRELSAKAEGLYFKILIIVVLAVTFFTTLIYYTLRSILHRLKQLNDETNRISRGGEISSNIQDNTPDEIGNLTKNFNRMIEQLASAIQASEDANQAKSNFLANFSHELRTPLTSIIGYSELMTEGDLNNQKKAISSIRHNSEIMLSIINNILDMSKIEHGDIQINIQQCEINKTLKNIFSLLMIKAEKKNITLSLTTLPDYLPSVLIDETLLKQILINLIDNAIKFSDEGSTIYIEASIGQDRSGNAALKVNVKDNGIGIEKDKIEKIFDPYFRISKDLDKKQPGVGLGLMLSKQFTRLLNGSLTVSSTELVGSTFHLEIPVTIVGIAQRQLERESINEKNLSGLSILIVEDNDINREIFCKLLEKLGATVTQAVNGKEALDYLLQENLQVNLVLMDMEMPVMDGYTAVTELRTAGFTKPIVALTAGVFQEEEKRSMDAGCDAFVSKPIDKESLGRVCLKNAR